MVHYAEKMVVSSPYLSCLIAGHVILPETIREEEKNTYILSVDFVCAEVCVCMGKGQYIGKDRMSERKSREGEDSGQRQVHLHCKDV